LACSIAGLGSSPQDPSETFQIGPGRRCADHPRDRTQIILIWVALTAAKSTPTTRH
jgi:hypothetical protein